VTKKIIAIILVVFLYTSVFWVFGAAYAISNGVQWYFGVIFLHLCVILLLLFFGVLKLIIWLLE
jgi:hypothetical protein